MSRLASLDYLRGLAALAVALPHYVMLGATDWHYAQVISILAVEQFFVLSGFVLAPQMIHCLQAAGMRDIGVFLVRRWMRTIPPYLVALALVALITANLFHSALGKYAIYIQNFAWPLPAEADFFPVAWSLSVEEWFYVAFAIMIVCARLLRLSLRSFILATVGFVIVISVARIAYGDMATWDASVRRVVVFRLDSIAWGFLLYCGLETLRAAFSGSKRILLLILLCATGSVAFYAGWQAAIVQSRPWQHAYPFASSGFAIITILALIIWNERFQTRTTVANTGYFLGKVSYTIYLFHLPIVLIVRPLISNLPLSLQLAVYTALLVAFCTCFYFSFEEPILRARPHYPRPEANSTPHSRHRGMVAGITAGWRDFSRHRIVLAGSIFALLVASIIAVERFQQRNVSSLFYISLIAAAVLLIAFLHASRLWRFAFPREASVAILIFSLLLPAADAVLQNMRSRKATGAIVPVYSFNEARGNPEAFLAWWVAYAEAWQKSSAAIQARDPQGRLPFVMIPNSRSSFFGAPININNYGFRGPDIRADKNGKYRVFVLGESPTFGTMISKEDLTWVQALQMQIEEKLACTRSVEIINAGTAAYNIEHNIERMRRDILPLQPDMIISYHGYNSYGMIDSDIERIPAVPALRHRGSLLLSEARFRLRLMAYNEISRSILSRPPSPYSSRHAQKYEELARIARESGVTAVFATLSLAVNATSPKDVIDFYGRVFRPIERILPAIAEHNRMIKDIALKTGFHYVDSRPGLDGEWDRDYFIDVVHFTHKGALKLASNVFEGIEPLLMKGAECRRK
jgi:peptidoglycan/LPS O-acetylase OafA/YrhL/lysophospholipase L1-like esterase